MCVCVWCTVCACVCVCARSLTHLPTHPPTHPLTHSHLQDDLAGFIDDTELDPAEVQRAAEALDHELQTRQRPEDTFEVFR